MAHQERPFSFNSKISKQMQKTLLGECPLSLMQIITPLGPVNNSIIDSRPEFPSVSEGPRGSLMS